MQINVKAGLDFSSRTIRAFSEICDANGLRNLTTTVTVGEVNAKISEHINEALQAVITFRRKAKILTDSEDAVVRGLFAEFDGTAVEHQANEVFRTFLDESDALILPVNGINAEAIFEDYFKRRPPFGEGKKKSEFPDAFTLRAISEHIGVDGKVYVVSEDTDLISFCKLDDRFIVVDSLSQVLDAYNAHDVQRTDAIKSFVADKSKEFQKQIKQLLENAEVYNNSSWEHAEVVSFTVSDIPALAPDIISIDDDECVIAFNIDVDLNVTVEGPDFNNGYYDREDGRVITFEECVRTEKVELELEVVLTVSVTVAADGFTFIDEQLEIDSIRRGIEVSVEENGSEYDF